MLRTEESEQRSRLFLKLPAATCSVCQASTSSGFSAAPVSVGRGADGDVAMAYRVTR